MRDYAARGASGEANLGRREGFSVWERWADGFLDSLVFSPSYIVRHNTFPGHQHLFKRRCPGDVRQAHYLASRGALPPEHRREVRHEMSPLASPRVYSLRVLPRAPAGANTCR